MGNHFNFKNRAGEKQVTSQGYEVEIIEYFSTNNCTIIFNDRKNTMLKNVRYAQIKKGTIKNPYHPTVHNIGFMGIGKYTCSVEGIETKSYRKWIYMFQRCYNEKSQKKRLTYKYYSIDEKWHNFQNFAEWYEENWKPHMEGWHLDKDILVKGNKVYSPETCCFVPQEINPIFSIKPKPLNKTPYYHKFQVQMNKYGKKTYIGLYDTELEALQAYKEAKEDYIKEVADKWKPYIDLKVYEAMYNWVIEIMD